MYEEERENGKRKKRKGGEREKGGTILRRGIDKGHTTFSHEILPLCVLLFIYRIHAEGTFHISCMQYNALYQRHIEMAVRYCQCNCKGAEWVLYLESYPLTHSYDVDERGLSGVLQTH